MSTTTIERVLALRTSELFSAVAAEDLVPLAHVAEEVRFVPGDVVMRRSDPADHLLVIVEGEVDVRVDGVGSLGTKGRGSVIGEMALISRTRTADCVALEDVFALRIDYEAFWELLALQPPLALGLITTLMGRLEDALAALSAANGTTVG